MKYINKKLASMILTGSIVLLSGCSFTKDSASNNILPVMEVHAETNNDELVQEPVSESTEQEALFGNIKGITYKKINVQGITTSNVYFRTGPSTNYESIDIIENGTQLQLIGKTANDWYMTIYQGQLGYLSGKYINEIDLERINEQMNNMPNLVKAVYPTTSLNVRKDSNTDSEILGTLSYGEKVVTTSRLANGWYQVKYNGQTGYVSGDYVNETYILDGDFTKIVYMYNDTNILDRPFGQKIDTLPYLEVGYVYGEVEDFYLIESNGLIGYVPKSCVGSLSGVYVIVDISDQLLKLYDGTKLLLTSEIVSGKNSTPSDYGIFNIYMKELNATLEGPGYSSPVSYWMPYNGGEGLHDAPWRDYFGGEIYKEYGSHGCVNCPYYVAQELYENVYVGSQVLVKK